MENINSALTETFDIPGYSIYQGTVPKSVTLRAMTAKEERMRIAGTSFNVIPMLIQKCIVDSDFDVSQLKMFDIQRLMYALRIVTYGPDYPVKLKCPKCGRTIETTLNLDQIPLNYAPEDFKEPFEIGPLPITGDVLTCKIPSLQDMLDIIDERNRMMKRSPEMEDPSFVLEYTKKIRAVNGAVLAPSEMFEYVNNLYMKDIRFFDCRYAEFDKNFGMEKFLELECPHCNNSFKFEVPVSEEFFRPEL